MRPQSPPQSPPQSLPQSPAGQSPAFSCSRFFVCGTAADLDSARAGDLVSVAVSADGRRAAAHLVVDDALVAAWPTGVVAVLDHAGPIAALWATERPLGPGLVAEALTGRVPRVVDDVSDLVAAYARAAAAFRSRGVAVVVGAFVDNFCHAALSPLMCRPPRADVVHAIVAACAPVDVAVVVDDLAPAGIDATAGCAHAVALARAAGAARVYATVGTVRLRPLLERDKGDSVDDTGFFVDSVAFATAAVRAAGAAGVDVVAVGAAAASDAALMRRANALKLQGISRVLWGEALGRSPQ